MGIQLIHYRGHFVSHYFLIIHYYFPIPPIMEALLCEAVHMYNKSVSSSLTVTGGNQDADRTIS